MPFVDRTKVQVESSSFVGVLRSVQGHTCLNKACAAHKPRPQTPRVRRYSNTYWVINPNTLAFATASVRFLTSNLP